jgi:hypothetical protein
MKNFERKITFGMAHWRIPSVEGAFDGILEGKPADKERKEIIEKVQRDRAEWAPTAEAWEQFQQVKKIVGYEVVVQMWDPIMVMLDDEGPYPMQAFCTGLHLITDEDDKPQAYLSLKDVRNIKTHEGYDGSSRLSNSSCAGENLLSLSDIYEISWGDKEYQKLTEEQTSERGIDSTEYMVMMNTQCLRSVTDRSRTFF